MFKEIKSQIRFLRGKQPEEPAVTQGNCMDHLYEASPGVFRFRRVPRGSFACIVLDRVDCLGGNSPGKSLIYEAPSPEALGALVCDYARRLRKQRLDTGAKDSPFMNIMIRWTI